MPRKLLNTRRQRAWRKEQDQRASQATFKLPMTKEEREKEVLKEYEQIKREKYDSSLNPSTTRFIDVNFNFQHTGELNDLEKVLSEGEKRRMQKLCKNIIPEDATHLRIKYSKKTVLIIFQYVLKTKYHSVTFRDVVKGNHQLQNFIDQQFIFSIYDKLYSFLNDEFRQLSRWCFYQSTGKELEFGFTEQDMMSSQSNYKIYYICSHTQGKVLFTILNHRHDIANFSSIFMQKNKDTYKEYYKLYLEFKQLIINDYYQEKDKQWNFKGFGEIDSENSEGEDFIQSNEKARHKLFDKLRQRINQILNKDLSLYQHRLQAYNLQEKKEDEQDDFKEEEIKIVKSQYKQKDQLEKNILIFKQSVQKETQKMKTIRKKYSKNKLTQEYRNVLKRLLFAEKILDSKLPILSYKEEIIKKISQSNLIILEGETGSGKSTQLPQILCEYFNAFEDSDTLPILITQPWKLATRTLAQRVADQLEEKVHGFVDYQASANSRTVNINAKIIFKLDRLVAQELQKDPLLSKYSCLVIDEAHERTLNIDIILGKISNLLLWRSNFKIVITSASLDIKLFQKHFNASSLKIPGRMYQVTEIFKPLPSIKDTKSKIYNILTTKMMNNQSQQQLKGKFYGHILIFCSGIEQIIEIQQYLRVMLNVNMYKILALHSRLNPNEQREAFQETTKIKIILATSLAETSITINGIKTVIDTGIDQEMIYEPKNKMYNIIEKKISTSSAKQRAGRAGRTSEGFCFRLYSKIDKESMQPNKIPQICNIALDTLILRLKAMNVQNISSFQFITQPEQYKIKQSISSMKMIGCLNEDETLTIIGNYLSKIPMEPLIAKALAQSMLYGEAASYHIKVMQKNAQSLQKMQMNIEQLSKLCNNKIQDRVIKILAMIINSTNLFIMGEHEINEPKLINQSKLWQEGDFFYLENIYNKFNSLIQNKQTNELLKWAQKKHLSVKTLYEAKETYDQILSILQKFKPKAQQMKQQISLCYQKIAFLKSADQCVIACLISSFLPNLSIYSGNPMIGYTMISQKVPVQISRTSLLAINKIYPKWLIAYNLFPNKYGQTICRIAQGISFSFLKIIVPLNILKQYKILEAEQNNPFYTTNTRVVPTLIYSKFQKAYKSRNSEQNLKFLRQYNILFNDHQNQLKVFHPQSNQKSLQMQILDNYLKNLIQQFQFALNHQYAGTVQASFGTGLQIVNFKIEEINYLIRINKTDQEIKEKIRSQTEQLNVKILDIYNKLKIEVFDQHNRKKVKKILNRLNQQYPDQCKFDQFLLDNRKKIPRYRLTIVFFTGYSQDQNSKIFLNYHRKSDEYFINTTRRNYLYLLEAKVKMIRLKKDEVLRHATIKKSKTQTGINIFIPRQYGEFDQFQVEELLKDYQKMGLLSNQFEFPWRLMVFREPEEDICYYSTKDWEQTIIEMMNKFQIPEDIYTLKAKGWKYKGMKNSQQPVYTDIICHIESFTDHYLKQFEKRLQKQPNSQLGNGKVHCRIQFLQNVVFVRNNVFIALKEQYLEIIKQMKKKYPALFFEVTVPLRFKEVYKVFIQVRGNCNSKLTNESVMKIRQLFRPEQLSIEPKYFFLFNPNNLFRTRTITQILEIKYKFKVYFIFDQMFGLLFIYAPKSLKNKILDQLIKTMKQVEFISQSISFVGKSLTKIQAIIKQEQKKLIRTWHQKRMCDYNIFYNSKNILLIADTQTLQNIKNRIALISHENIVQCQLCCSSFVEKFRLIQCQDQFCKVCITEYVKGQSLSNQGKIQCPQKCGQFINIYDIEYILGSTQFIRVCDLRVSNYISNNQDSYHGCYTPDCPQIFRVTEDTKKSQYFECSTCGITYCFKCKNTHQEQECVNQIILDATLKQLNIKKCPSCGQGVEKNKGCNHVECIKCKCHFCWICSIGFTSSQKCCAHLLQKHGSFYDQPMGINLHQFEEFQGFDEFDEFDEFDRFDEFQEPDEFDF